MKIERSTTTRERKGTFVMRFSSLVLCLAAASVALGQAAPATSPAVPLPSLPLPPLIAPPATAPSDAKPDALLTIFRAGQYQDTIDAATKILAESPDAPVEVWQLKIRAQLLTGKYDDALQAYRKAVDAHDESLSIRMLGWQTLLDNNKTAEAKKLLKEILDLADADSWRYADAANRVALGEAMLRSGTDARRVLENYYDRAKRSDPNLLAPLMATGELALEKHDFAMATEAYRAAQKIAPDDPDVYVGLAKASEDDDPEAAATAVAKALELNPNHMDALLMVADRQIYSEQYTNAGTTLGKAISVNPKEPRAWAYLAVLANLTGKHDSEVAARAEALDIWKTNPAVDELIGEKLAQEYRFAEGAEYQKKSLAFDADYLPAKFELSQDLLRLGKEEDGWKLVDEVFKKDPYNVTAFNLMTLHDVMEKMTVLTTDHFIVHMDPKEAQIYGQRVLDLLEKARANFTAKYDVQLPEKTNIEIFTTQADFAVRTFGLPGEEGFLGVCFGPVVTVNSPAAQGAHLTNWESILWHEFCHTITLTKTKNKMPRWLSEGISVYEERQGNPGWGEQFIPPTARRFSRAT